MDKYMNNAKKEAYIISKNNQLKLLKNFWHLPLKKWMNIKYKKSKKTKIGWPWVSLYFGKTHRKDVFTIKHQNKKRKSEQRNIQN